MTEEFWKLILIRAAERGCKNIWQLAIFMGLERTYIFSFRSNEKRSSRLLHQLLDNKGAMTKKKKPRKVMGVYSWFGPMLYFLDITPDEIVKEDNFYTVDSASNMLKSHEELGKKLKAKSSTIYEMDQVQKTDVIRSNAYDGIKNRDFVFCNRKFDQKDLEYLAYILQGPEPVYIHNIPQILSLLRR